MLIFAFYIDYILVDMNYFLVYSQTMLEGLFGNKTAEKVLLHVFHYGESHASGIAQDFNAPMTPIIKQLDRFEGAGILVSKVVGRSRIYSFNMKSALVKHVKEIIEIAYESIPIAERQKIFKTRRRPRAKGKPVL